MRILILGGTKFIGRVFIERLMATGKRFDCTIFQRGQTGSDLFPEVPRILGDRENLADLDKLAAQDWDVVVDFSAYYPDSLQYFLQKSQGRIGRLIFTSTVSVYPIPDDLREPLIEQSTIWSCTPEQRKDQTMATYGPRKVACEQEILAQVAKGLDAVILRPSVVFGKYDYINRHLYWLHRVATQPRILLPNGGVQTDNYTFVEDYAELIVRAMQAETHNIIYNASTQRVHTLRQLVEAAAAHAGTSPELVSASVDALQQIGLDTQNERISLFWGGINAAFDNQKAINDFGNFYHSMEEGTAKTFDYYQSIGWAGLAEIEQRYLSEEREQFLLKQLKP